LSINDSDAHLDLIFVVSLSSRTRSETYSGLCLNWFRDLRELFLLAVIAFFKYRRLLLVALWALDFLLFATVITVDVKEGWLSTIYAINVERLSATGASLVFSVDFRTASRTSDV
jgi:hypothetical protein